MLSIELIIKGFYEAKSMEIKRKKQAKEKKNPTCRLMR